MVLQFLTSLTWPRAPGGLQAVLPRCGFSYNSNMAHVAYVDVYEVSRAP